MELNQNVEKNDHTATSFDKSESRKQQRFYVCKEKSVMKIGQKILAAG